MAGSPPVSASNVRSNKRRWSGLRLIVMLCTLFLVLVMFTWSEELLEPLHAENLDSHAFKEPSLGDKALQVGNGDEEAPKVTIEAESSMFSAPTNNVYGNLMERFKKHTGHSISERKETKHFKQNKQPKNHKGGALRQKETTAEGFTLPIILSTDDSIPTAAEGSVVHAVDALLCRDSVLDYVINATDLKDECDGLIKAYTQTCDADDNDTTNPKARHRERLLTSENHPIMYWQQTLYDWSQYFQSQFQTSVATRRFLIEDETLGEEEESFADSTEHISLWGQNNSTFQFPSVKFQGMARRKVKAEESGNDQGVEEKVEPAEASPLPDKKEKKPLANLALPVTSKHVSEKLLTETLMLQQDNKLMKAVVNQTNFTVTEAQADAAVSSKAVAEAADMVSNILNDPTSVEARTCCTSILSVFHENCSVNEEELSDRRLFVGVGVIALCGLIKSLIRHFHIRWLPEAAGCILVGGTYEIRLALSDHTQFCSTHPHFLILTRSNHRL